MNEYIVAYKIEFNEYDRVNGTITMSYEDQPSAPQFMRDLLHDIREHRRNEFEDGQCQVMGIFKL